MFRNLIYKIAYNPRVNYLLRTLSRAIFKALGKGYMFPVSGIIELPLSTGKKIYLETNQTDFVAKWVYYKGIYEYEYVSIFEKLLEKCTGVIDIGCNAGLYSLLSASCPNDNIKVLSFDPSTASAYFMPRNIERNRVGSKVSYYNVALSNFNGNHTFYEVKNPKYPFEQYNLGGASSLVNLPEEYRENTVSVFRLDDFLKEKGLDIYKFDIMKIDAEGAEPMIIEGMHALIDRCKPILICEILFGSSENRLAEVISDYKYGIYFHKGTGLVKVDSLNAFNDDLVRNCFLVPMEKIQWIKQFVS